MSSVCIYSVENSQEKDGVVSRFLVVDTDVYLKMFFEVVSDGTAMLSRSPSLSLSLSLNAERPVQSASAVAQYRHMMWLPLYSGENGP